MDSPSTLPFSLRTSISPPPRRVRAHDPEKEPPQPNPNSDNSKPDTAAIEAGTTQIIDHLSYFSTHLSRSQSVDPTTAVLPPLSIPAFKQLYQRNQHPAGRHFVIHQHDHPVAGLHYDLRLQISGTSSVSWAVMYGMPGDVNSRRLNRNATETRVHNVWNHLVETASVSTGSLLIWDTGEYEMLPYRQAAQETDDEHSTDSSSSSSDANPATASSDSQKLHQSFQNRRIRIRLHGHRLPKNYTLSLRLLTSENRHAQPPPPTRKRRRHNNKPHPHTFSETQVTPPTSDIDEDGTVPDVHTDAAADAKTPSYEKELQEQEDETVRLTNAYPGASNTIGSIHQRRWYLSMDRFASGFVPKQVQSRVDGNGRREWVRRWEGGEQLGFESFIVAGREVERSVVTGRRAEEVLRDEGVVGFVGRKGWRAVVE